MKALKFTIKVEDLPDHAKDYRIAGALCSAATQELRKESGGYGDQVNVVVITEDQACSAAEIVTPRHSRRPKAPATIFYLFFDPGDGAGGRYVRNTYGLHCGDCLLALIDGAWIETRIEHSSFSDHSHGWYLVTHPNQPLEDLPVGGRE